MESSLCSSKTLQKGSCPYEPLDEALRYFVESFPEPPTPPPPPKKRGGGELSACNEHYLSYMGYLFLRVMSTSFNNSPCNKEQCNENGTSLLNPLIVLFRTRTRYMTKCLIIVRNFSVTAPSQVDPNTVSSWVCQLGLLSGRANFLITFEFSAVSVRF